MRAAFERLATELDVLPGALEPETAGGESRGLLARLSGERGQSSAEAMGLLPIVAIVVLGMWQLGLVGYTYMLAGHAAREGARELATDPRDTEKEKPYRVAAREDLPTAWRKSAEITLPGDKDEVRVRVNVKLDVPVVIPGVRQRLHDRLERRYVRREPGAAALATGHPDADAAMIARLAREERGQASAELMAMVFWLLLAGMFAWQLMLGAWTVTQASNAARTATRVDARGGDAEKAAFNALSSPLRHGFDRKRSKMEGETATVVVKIPIVLPGLTIDGFKTTRTATLPGV